MYLLLITQGIKTDGMCEKTVLWSVGRGWYWGSGCSCWSSICVERGEGNATVSREQSNLNTLPNTNYDYEIAKKPQILVDNTS